jgi:NADH-quinone oxidoreductase subunit E
MMMVKAGKQDDGKKVADEAASLSNLADASAKLFAEQAAAMAVFTAYGMSVATQMTGMMLGAFRGPACEMGETEAQPKAETKGNVVHLRRVEETKPQATVKAPVVKTAAAKTPARKPATAKRAARKVEAKVTPNASADDLKKIPGIGPRLEKVLNERGIARYGDIAGLGKAALKKLDTELGLEGRVIRDDWAGQAKALSGGKG